MNKIKIGFIMLLSFMLACQNSEDSINYETSIKTDEVVFNLSVDVSKDELLTYSTASQNESYIDGLYVLYFNSTGSYRTGAYINGSSIIGNGTANPIFSLKLKPLASDKILLLANTGKTVAPNTLMSGKGLTNVNAVFGGSININQLDPNSGRGLPMASESLFTFKTSNGNSESNPISVTLVRSVAKIQVKIAENLPNPFSNLANVTYQCRNVLSPASFSIYEGGGVTNITFTNPTDIFKVVNTPGASLSETTYYLSSYQYSTNAKGTAMDSDKWSPNRMHLVVNASGQFYRIDFARNSEGKQTYIDVDRNTNIVLTIKSVKAAGYGTSAHASAMPGNNLECDINVTADNSDVIKSNGQYAVILSHDSKLIVGPSGTYDISTVKYQMGDNITSFNFGGLENKVELVGVGSNVASLLPTGLINPTGRQIKLKVEDESTSFNAAIIVTLGNIKDTILVERYPTSKFDVNSAYEITGSMLGIRWLNNDNAAGVGLSASSSKIVVDVPLLTGRKSFLQGVSKGVLHGRMKSKLAAYAKKTASSMSLEIYKETSNKITFKTNAPVGGSGYVNYKSSNIFIPINDTKEYTFRTGENLQAVTANSTLDGNTLMPPIGWDVNGTRVNKDSPAGINPFFDLTIPYVTKEATNFRLHMQIVDDAVFEAIYDLRTAVLFSTNIPEGEAAIYLADRTLVPVGTQISHMYTYGDKLEVITADSKNGSVIYSPLGWEVNGKPITRTSPNGKEPYVTKEKDNQHYRLHIWIEANMKLEAIYNLPMIFESFFPDNSASKNYGRISVNGTYHDLPYSLSLVPGTKYTVKVDMLGSGDDRYIPRFMYDENGVSIPMDWVESTLGDDHPYYSMQYEFVADDVQKMRKRSIEFRFGYWFLYVARGGSIRTESIYLLNRTTGARSKLYHLRGGHKVPGIASPPNEAAYMEFWYCPGDEVSFNWTHWPTAQIFKNWEFWGNGNHVKFYTSEFESFKPNKDKIDSWHIRLIRD